MSSSGLFMTICSFSSWLSSAGRPGPEQQRARAGRAGQSELTHQMATTSPPKTQHQLNGRHGPKLVHISSKKGHTTVLWYYTVSLYYRVTVYFFSDYKDSINSLNCSNAPWNNFKKSIQFIFSRIVLTLSSETRPVLQLFDMVQQVYCLASDCWQILSCCIWKIPES